MTLKVIGAGFGRTGTHTLKLALEMLGYGPCYHMAEVFQHPEHVPTWQAATDGEPVDWDAFFDGYRTTVDWPSTYFWRELTALYPEAKVLLSVRDGERWYESVANTIYRLLTMPPEPNQPLPPQQRMARQMILEQIFGGRFDERDHAIEVYRRHNEEVQRSVPAHKLLVYEVTAGWEPLCEFLACPVPQEPFPRSNSTEEFQGRMAARQAAAKTAGAASSA